MYGGLKKSVSLVALVAAAGILSTGANAADLGGDCCADLEERVAELEATTARKGNRRVSLTISGQVNRATMHFNDGYTSNTFFGLDNTNSSTRFSLSGNAKVTPAVTAGFSILIDVADKARTYTVSQGNEDATAWNPSCNAAGACNTLGGANGDHALRLRDANWWLEHSSVGRLTVGRLTTAGAVAGIDLAGIQVVASSSPGLVGGGLAFRGAGGLFGPSLNAFTDAGGYPTTRGDGIRYNSPTFAGFTFGASIAEATSVEVNNGSSTGRNLGVDLRYAGEFSGVRIAAGIGWEKFEGNGDGVMNAGAGTSPSNPYAAPASTEQWGASLALMHVPTGLFLQGDYLSSEHTSAAYVGSRDTTRWLVQGGIAQNWFGIGRTSLYGEYGKAESWLFAKAISFGNAGGTLDGDGVKYWGLGVVQTLDAAAMDLYLGYRNFKANDAIGGESSNLHVVTAGARIRF